MLTGTNVFQRNWSRCFPHDQDLGINLKLSF
jgi:hypothetical protein